MTQPTQQPDLTGVAAYQRPERSAVRNAILIAATITTGLTAGTFADWSNAVMPGLREVDDRTFVLAFRALDAAIVSPAFLTAFMGTPALIAVSTVLDMRAKRRTAAFWQAIALAVYLTTWAITFGINEPLNQQLRSGLESADVADFTALRTQFDEAKWTTWNTVRAVASTVALGCLAGALAIRRRRRG